MNDTRPSQNAGEPTPQPAPADAHLAATPPEPLAPEATAPAGGGWRHRVLGIRGVAAVALAGLVLGGLGGAALGTLGDGGHRDGGPGGFDRPGTTLQDGRLPGGTEHLGAPGQPPADAPGVTPGTTQQEDVSPDSGGDTPSGDNT